MVISFETARYLKEKGVKQQSLFYWVQEGTVVTLMCNKYIRELITGSEEEDIEIPDNTYSAFLTDELLPAMKRSGLSEADQVSMTIRFKNQQLYIRPMYSANNIGSLLLKPIRYDDWLTEKRRQRREEKSLEKRKAITGERVPKNITQLNKQPHGKVH